MFVFVFITVNVRELFLIRVNGIYQNISDCPEAERINGGVNGYWVMFKKLHPGDVVFLFKMS